MPLGKDWDDMQQSKQKNRKFNQYFRILCFSFSDSEYTAYQSTFSNLKEAVMSKKRLTGSVPENVKSEQDLRKEESMHPVKRSISNVSDSVKTDHDLRIKHLQNACANIHLYPKVAKPKNIAFKYFSKQYHFSYYKIAKAGSSVWTQIFAVLNSVSNETDDIFYKGRNYVHTVLQEENFKVENKKGPTGPFVIPAREPYSRLYSAYMDKIIFSLADKELDHIIEKQRKIGPNMFGCIRNATFLEFLRFIVTEVENGEKLNRHWSPITSLCNPCKTDVLAIVKQETFTSDVEFVLEKVRVTNGKLELIHNALHEQRLDATLPSYIEEILNHETCRPKLEVAENLWHVLQNNGYVNEESAFPIAFIKDNNSTVTPDILTELVFKSMSENPLTSEQSRRQKRRALVNAYKDVDENIIKGLQEVYKRDFVFFNYSTQPPKD